MGRRPRASTTPHGSKVDLPHDWAVDLPFINDPILVEHGGKALGREYPETSIGWYRSEFVLPASDAGRRICVEFDGIFRNATVFFNGHYIAENMSGYAPLGLDLTDFANFADKQRAAAGRQKQAACHDGMRARMGPGDSGRMCWWCAWMHRSTKAGSTRARESIGTSG